MIRDAVRQLRDPTYALFLVAVAVNLIRAPNQPSVELGRGGTTLSVTPGDVLLGILLVVVLVGLARGRRPSRASLVVLGPAAAFSLWLFASALPNGGTATVAAGKLVEVAVLTLAAAVVLDRPERLLPLTLVIVAMTVAVAGVATIGGLSDPGRRQESFLGEHPMALLCTYSLVLAFLAWVGRDVRLGRLPLLAGVFGAAGIVFGASFSGLLGLYLVAGVMLVIAFARASLRLRAIVAVLLVCAGITGATLTIRSDNLGFLQEWFGDTEQLEPGATAGSWSSRLIFAYVGMRIFLDHPIAGTGWYGELPPEEYARYLPDAHARYPDQPENYFPPADGTYIPQQAPDQVLYQLGVIGGTLFLLLGAASVWTGVRAARRWPPGVADELGAYVPLTWTLAAAGGLAGTALFGGTPFNTLVWIAVGVAAAAPRLVERAR